MRSCRRIRIIVRVGCRGEVPSLRLSHANGKAYMRSAMYCSWDNAELDLPLPGRYRNEGPSFDVVERGYCGTLSTRLQMMDRGPQLTRVFSLPSKYQTKIRKNERRLRISCIRSDDMHKCRRSCQLRGLVARKTDAAQTLLSRSQRDGHGGSSDRIRPKTAEGPTPGLWVQGTAKCQAKWTRGDRVPRCSVLCERRRMARG